MCGCISAHQPMTQTRSFPGCKRDLKRLEKGETEPLTWSYTGKRRNQKHLAMSFSFRLSQIAGYFGINRNHQ